MPAAGATTTRPWGCRRARTRRPGAAALSSVQQPREPRTVAVLNDYDLRVVTTQGEFTRQSHPETDEVFLVLSGSLTIRMDGGDVPL